MSGSTARRAQSTQIEGESVRVMSFEECGRDFAEVLTIASRGRDEVVIKRTGHDAVVVVSLAEYESLKETLHLMRSPANARRLLNAIERLERGVGTIRELNE